MPRSKGCELSAQACRARRRRGCRRCAYRKRLQGDVLCQRCREDRDVERAQKRQDALDAAAIDEFAAKAETAHRASNLDRGISPWNARPEPEATAAYWSPLPDPEPKSEQLWRHALDDDGWRLSRHCRPTPPGRVAASRFGTFRLPT